MKVAESARADAGTSTKTRTQATRSPMALAAPARRRSGHHTAMIGYGCPSRVIELPLVVVHVDADSRSRDAALRQRPIRRLSIDAPVSGAPRTEFWLERQQYPTSWL